MNNPTRTRVICPFCGTLNDAASALYLKGRVPQRGDISICPHCVEAGIYDKDEKGYVIVRKPTAAEWVVIVTNPEVIQAQNIITNANLTKTKHDRNPYNDAS